MKFSHLFETTGVLTLVALALIAPPAALAQTVISNETLVSTTFVVNKASATAKCGKTPRDAITSMFTAIPITNRAQPPSAATSQPKPPQTGTEPSGQVSGTVPTPPPTSAVADTQPPENQPMDAMPRKYVEMWNTGDFQPIGTMFTHPVFITFHGQKKLLETGTLVKVIASWRKSMPDLDFKIEDTIVQGDRVAMRLTFSGYYKERLFADTAAPEATPRKIHALEMLMFLIRDGKIAEVWDDYDELVMRLQMGAIWRSNAELGACSCKPAAESTPAPSPSSHP
jgi:predicted ester cyclase